MMNVAGTERTRLFVEGVGTAITAEVRGRRDDGLVVTRALPFLRLDTPVVAEGGTRARIARVAIAMEGDVPRLLLELAHEGEAPNDAPVVAPSARFTPGVSERPPRRDSTMPYDFAAGAQAARVVAVTEPSARDDEPTLAAPRAEPAAPPAPRRRWWARLLGRLAALLATWTRRSVPALPPG